MNLSVSRKRVRGPTANKPHTKANVPILQPTGFAVNRRSGRMTAKMPPTRAPANGPIGRQIAKLRNPNTIAQINPEKLQSRDRRNPTTTVVGPATRPIRSPKLAPSPAHALILIQDRSDGGSSSSKSGGSSSSK